MTGIYRATPLRVSRWQRNVKAVYKTYIDVIHFKKMDLKRLRERDEEEDGEGYVLDTCVLYRSVNHITSFVTV